EAATAATCRIARTPTHGLWRRGASLVRARCAGTFADPVPIAPKIEVKFSSARGQKGRGRQRRKRYLDKVSARNSVSRLKRCFYTTLDLDRVSSQFRATERGRSFIGLTRCYCSKVKFRAVSSTSTRPLHSRSKLYRGGSSFEWRVAQPSPSAA